LGNSSCLASQVTIGNSALSTAVTDPNTVVRMRVPCPHCGPRDVSEFSYGGEDRGVPSTDPDAEFARTFLRANLAGVVTEHWHHHAGCGAWFTFVRDTRIDTSDADAAL
jgi:heterotetrameric sarcosine oxidase delta subunit